jgi:hypothetical protein
MMLLNMTHTIIALYRDKYYFSLHFRKYYTYQPLSSLHQALHTVQLYMSH